MDLLFSYKGGDEFMNNVLLYFALKHDGDFEKIYNRRILMEDTVTVIYFTEVHEDL